MKLIICIIRQKENFNILCDSNSNHKGKFYSKVNSNYCVRLSNISKRTLILSECEGDGTTFYRENHSVLSLLLTDINK